MANSDRQSFLDRIRVSKQELNENKNNNQSNSEDNTEETGPDKGQASASATRLKRCRRTKPNVTTTEDTTADAESIV